MVLQITGLVPAHTVVHGFGQINALTPSFSFVLSVSTTGATPLVLVGITNSCPSVVLYTIPIVFCHLIYSLTV